MCDSWGPFRLRFERARSACPADVPFVRFVDVRDHLSRESSSRDEDGPVLAGVGEDGLVVLGAGDPRGIVSGRGEDRDSGVCEILVDEEPHASPVLAAPR